MFEIFGKVITAGDLALVLTIPVIVFLVFGGLITDGWIKKHKNPGKKMDFREYRRLNERRMMR